MAGHDPNFTFTTNSDQFDSYITGFTMKANIQEKLSEALDKHTGVRNHALKVLELHNAKAAAAKFERDRMVDLQRIAVEAELEKKRIAHERDVAAGNAEIERLRQMKIEASKPAPPPTPKPRPSGIVPIDPEDASLTESEALHLKEWLPLLEDETTKQAIKIIKKSIPDFNPRRSTKFVLDDLSDEDAQELLDLVVDEVPIPGRYIGHRSAPMGFSIDVELKRLGPKPRAASPPRNHLGLGLKVTSQKGKEPASAVPGHMQTGGPAHSKSLLSPAWATDAPASPLTPTTTDRNHEAADNDVHPYSERYDDIHQNLKLLRSVCKENPEMKHYLGTMRREIRKRVDQITMDSRKNIGPKNELISLLQTALTLNGPLVWAKDYVVDDRDVILDDEPNTINDAKVPAIFIYCLNILAKSFINQFIVQCSSEPKSATNIGSICVAVFAQPEFSWRGFSMIDILIAKFRKACPVLFGVRGSEKTENGRERLGWKRHPDGTWDDENAHSSRMTGLAAGYAAISLRDFSNSRMQNPYPPPNWWWSMAAICETHEEHTSNTQFIVLKWMIEGYESNIFKFYGDKARSSFLTSICLFPGKAKQKTAAVRAVSVMAERLRKDDGLVLSADQAPQPNYRPFNPNTLDWM